MQSCTTDSDCGQLSCIGTCGFIRPRCVMTSSQPIDPSMVGLDQGVCSYVTGSCCDVWGNYCLGGYCTNRKEHRVCGPGCPYYPPYYPEPYPIK